MPTSEGSYKMEHAMETDCTFPYHLLIDHSTSPNTPCFRHSAIVVLVFVFP